MNGIEWILDTIVITPRLCVCVCVCAVWQRFIIIFFSPFFDHIQVRRTCLVFIALYHTYKDTFSGILSCIFWNYNRRKKQIFSLFLSIHLPSSLPSLSRHYSFPFIYTDKKAYECAHSFHFIGTLFNFLNYVNFGTTILSNNNLRLSIFELTRLKSWYTIR